MFYNFESKPWSVLNWSSKRDTKFNLKRISSQQCGLIHTVGLKYFSSLDFHAAYITVVSHWNILVHVADKKVHLANVNNEALSKVKKIMAPWTVLRCTGGALFAKTCNWSIDHTCHLTGKINSLNQRLNWPPYHFDHILTINKDLIQKSWSLVVLYAVWKPAVL